MIFLTLGLVAAVCVFLTVQMYNRFWDRGLSAEISFEHHVVDEGQKLYLYEQIENRKILPLQTLLLKFEMDRELRCIDSKDTSVTDKMYRTDSFSVMPYTRVTRCVETTATKRGYYSIDEAALRSTLKNKGTAEARQVAMYLIRHMTNMSFPEIGREFGRDHSTVIHAIKKVETSLKDSTHPLHASIRDIKENINSSL